RTFGRAEMDFTVTLSLVDRTEQQLSAVAGIVEQHKVARARKFVEAVTAHDFQSPTILLSLQGKTNPDSSRSTKAGHSIEVRFSRCASVFERGLWSAKCASVRRPCCFRSLSLRGAAADVARRPAIEGSSTGTRLKLK